MLNDYISLLEVLKKVLPKNVEVVLHDVNNLENSIIGLVNGHITGRKIGDPATEVVLKLLATEKNQNVDALDVYKSKTKYGKELISHTLVIRGINKEVIGFLCFNTDYQMVESCITNVKNILFNYNVTEIDNKNYEENFIGDTKNVIDNTIEEFLVYKGKSIKYLTKQEKIELTSDLDEKGIFLLKGSVEKVAKILGVSVSTQYRYIKKGQ